jgi:ssDNA-binding Zn-finger/Zn-ribbon topoisomerase 1
VADDAAALVCPDCGAAMIPRTSAFGPFYGCERFPACRATHGAHPDGRPLGTPANAATKAARIRAHAAFDVLWKGGAMKRNEAYYQLSKALGITRAECHIANFDAAMCERVVDAVARLCGTAPAVADDAARERGR